MAGADSEIFNSHEKKVWDKNTKLKLVTHHWGANWNKGFDTYVKIDQMLNLQEWKNIIEFTYIEIYQKILNLIIPMLLSRYQVKFYQIKLKKIIYM